MKEEEGEASAGSRRVKAGQAIQRKKFVQCARGAPAAHLSRLSRLWGKDNARPAGMKNKLMAGYSNPHLLLSPAEAFRHTRNARIIKNDNHERVRRIRVLEG